MLMNNTLLAILCLFGVVTILCAYVIILFYTCEALVLHVTSAKQQVR